MEDPTLEGRTLEGRILLWKEKATLTMQIKIQSVHFDADQKLKNFVEEKLEKLERFDENIIGMEVYLRDEKNGEEQDKTVEAKVFVPGKDLFAKKSSDSFESATDELLDALQRQVKKHKEKLRGA